MAWRPAVSSRLLLYIYAIHIAAFTCCRCYGSVVAAVLVYNLLFDGKSYYFAALALSIPLLFISLSMSGGRLSSMVS